MHDFEQFFAFYHSKGQIEHINAFKLISHHFPSMNSTRGIIDTETHWNFGGTFIKNFPLTVEHATTICDAIREMNCAGKCFFLVPIMSCTDVSWASKELDTETNKASLLRFVTNDVNAILAYDFTVNLPPIFALHSFSTNDICVNSLFELYTANVINTQLHKVDKEYTELMTKIRVKMNK